MRFIEVRSLLAFLFLLGSSSLHAQSIPTKTGDKVGPTIQMEKGQPIVVTWKDGREATVQLSNIASFESTFPIQIFENTCKYEKIGAQCDYHFNARSAIIALKWTKNPDPTKLGKTVTIKSNDPGNTSSTTAETQVFALATDKKKFPIATQDLDNDSITCRDFSFLPGVETSAAPDTLSIIRWEGEFSLRNNETDMDENRPFGGFSDMKWTKRDAQSLTLASPGVATGSATPLVSDNSAFTLTNTDGDSCQITIKADKDILLRDVQKTAAQLQAYTTYILGSDEFFYLAYLSQNAKSWFDLTEPVYDPATQTSPTREKIAQ